MRYCLPAWIGVAALLAFESPLSGQGRGLEVNSWLGEFNDFSVNRELVFPLDASGGAAPYRWELSGTYPEGMRIGDLASIWPGSNSKPALYHAGPNTARVYAPVVTVTDSAGAKVSRTLRLVVSALWLEETYVQSAIGRWFRVALRGGGGRLPYRFVLSEDAALPLGVQFDEGKGEFSGALMQRGGFGVSLKVIDPAGNELRNIFGFEGTGTSSALPPVGWRRSTGPCGEESVTLHVYSATPEQIEWSLDWGDGSVVEKVPGGYSKRITHRYDKDGAFDLAVEARLQGQTVRAVSAIAVAQTQNPLCQVSLRLHPPVNYLQRGKTWDHLALEARDRAGEYVNLASHKVEWVSLNPAILSVDSNGNISCPSVGESWVEARVGDLKIPVRSHVYCGEVRLAPPVVHLSNTAGNDTAKLGLEQYDSEGKQRPWTGVTRYYLNPAADGPVTMDPEGNVKVIRSPRGRAEMVVASADGQVPNLTKLRILDVPLGSNVTPWTGANVQYWIHEQLGDFDYAAIFRDNGVLRISDLIYEREEELAGYRPNRGHIQQMAHEVGYDNDGVTPCGVSGNPAGFGTRLDAPVHNSCLIVADPNEPQPQWGVIGHEIGHNYHFESRRFLEFLYGVPRGGPHRDPVFFQHAVAESFASHYSCYALWSLSDERAAYAVADRTADQLNRVCVRFPENLPKYLATGPDFYQIDVGGFFDVLLQMQIEYGVEAQRRFLSVFGPPDESLPFRVTTVEQQASFIASAWSAAAKVDLRERFRKEFGFPIDDAWYNANHRAMEAMAAQRDVSCSAGAERRATVGQPVQLEGEAFSPSRRPLSYAWKAMNTPEGGEAAFSDAGSPQPEFTGSKSGEYVLEMVARDGLFTSKGCRVRIVVD